MPDYYIMEIVYNFADAALLYRSIRHNFSLLHGRNQDMSYQTVSTMASKYT